MTESTMRTRVRENDRQTSWDAAAAQTAGKVAEVQAAVMGALRSFGDMTDAELVAFLEGIPASSVRTRRHELEMAGWVTPVTHDDVVVRRRPSRSLVAKGGMPGVVWRAVRDDEEPPAPSSRGRRGETKHERGLAAARRLGRWEWGDEAYADAVLAAYLDPAAAHERMDREGAPA